MSSSRAKAGRLFFLAGTLSVLCVASWHPCLGQDQSGETNWLGPRFAERAKAAFEAASVRYSAHKDRADAAWEFGRVSFAWAEFSKTDKQRELIALQGIEACRRAVQQAPDSGPAHYYLAMNLGQLARTKLIGALRLVNEMETEFLRAIEASPDFDFAGPDRNLGWLYLQAPGWPASIGNNSKARKHIEKAVERKPDYPPNRLNRLEAYLKWGDRQNALDEFKAIQELLPQARKKLAGERWEQRWVEWDQDWKRLQEQAMKLSRN